MKPAAHSISTQRLDRLMRWSQLTLLHLARWIVHIAGAWAPLERSLERALERPLKTLSRIVCTLIVLKAIKRIPPPENRSRRPALTSGPTALRRLFGAHLRHRLKARDPREKIARLMALLRDAEAEIARFARHFKYRFTRRLGGFVPEQKRAPALLCAVFCALRFSDTS